MHSKKTKGTYLGASGFLLYRGMIDKKKSMS